MQRQEDEYEAAMDGFLKRVRERRELEWADGRKPPREELHDRRGERRSAFQASSDALNRWRHILNNETGSVPSL